MSILNQSGKIRLPGCNFWHKNPNWFLWDLNTYFYSPLFQTDNHADIVYKLRNLVESGNRITLNLDKKAIKSSQTLQIIQSRLAYKQQVNIEWTT